MHAVDQRVLQPEVSAVVLRTFAFFALTVVACQALVQTAPARPPNIIFIMADDLGYGELGCYGQKMIRTPSIDRLAAEGMRFTQFYSGSPVCASARCVLMTGLHPGHAYIRTNKEVRPEGQWPIPDEAVTVAELLKQRGYATGAMGKWGLGPPGSNGSPLRQGFDHWFGYNCQRQAHNFYPRYLWRNETKVSLAGNDRGLTGEQYSHDLITEEALQFISDHKHEPFFLYVPFTIPHLAIQVPEDSLVEYKGKWPDPPYEGGKGYLPHLTPRAGYAAMVTRMDRDVGRIAELVKRLGLDENTIIFFTSDNGPTYDRLGGSDSDFFNSSGPLRGRKGRLYEGGIRVPLVARWPGIIDAASTSDHVAAFWDVLPSLVTLADGTPPGDVDGMSFAAELLGNDQPKHDYLYWEFPSYGGQQAVRLGDWKALRTNMFKGNMQVELYNLADDVAESNDVANEHPDVIAQVEAIMQQAHVPSEVFPFMQIDQ